MGEGGERNSEIKGVTLLATLIYLFFFGGGDTSKILFERRYVIKTGKLGERVIQFANGIPPNHTGAPVPMKNEQSQMHTAN